MVAEFTIIGRVGKINYPPKGANKNYIIMNVATWSYYNGEKQTNWMNNIYAFGKLSDFVRHNVTGGNEVYISGKITSKQNDKGMTYFFVADKVIITKYTMKQTSAYNQKKHDEKPNDEESYNKPEYDESGGDDIPY